MKKELQNRQFEDIQGKWEAAGIGNDYIFSCVMRDEDLFLRLMQMVFPELHLTKVWRHTTQKTLLAMSGSKSIRLDVYSEIDDKVFNVEMQLWNSRGFDPARRTRYYQSVIDEQSLQSGMLYRDLPDSYVVMFAPFDLFGKGRHYYRFRNYEDWDNSIRLQDGTVKVFINSNGIVDDINEDLKGFLRLMNGEAPENDYCREVQASVERVKTNPEMRRGFMDWEMQRKMDQAVYYDLGVEEGHEKGLEEGMEKGLKKGLEKGREEGMSKMLISLVHDRLISVSEGARRMNMTEDEFRTLL